MQDHAIGAVGDGGVGVGRSIIYEPYSFVAGFLRSF